MASVNKVVLIGHLGSDPETRYTSGGDAVTNFRMATSESWKDKNGDKQEKTEWHTIVTFGKRAEAAGEYLHKGSFVYVEGKLQTRKWQDKEGNDRYTTEIVCENFQFLDKKGDGERAERPAREPARRESSKKVDDLDDDIPF